MDIAASPAAFIEIWTRVSLGAPSFTLEPDGKIAYDAPQGFRLHVDLIEIGGGDISRIHVAEPLGGGYVASVSDLLLLRAMAVVNRGGDGNTLDFDWLLLRVVEMDEFPLVDEEELKHLSSAVQSFMGGLHRLIVAAKIGIRNEVAAIRLLDQQRDLRFGTLPNTQHLSLMI